MNPSRAGEAGDVKRFYVIRNAGHNDTDLVGGEPYWRAIAEFLETLPAPR